MPRFSTTQWLDNLASGLPGRETRHESPLGTIIATHWGSGARIVLVHGIGMGRSYFGRLRDALASAHEVIAVDLPGFGDSPQPDEPLSIEGLADALADYVCTLPAPVTALGHSMGTQIVAELGARHPELVRSVVLIAPTVNPDERSATRQAFRLVQDSLGEPLRVVLTAVVLYVKAGPLWFLAKLRAMMAHRIEDPVARLSVPALVVTGARDRVSPPDWARRLADLAPDGRALTASDTGHEAIITSAEPVASIVLDFVARTAD